MRNDEKRNIICRWAAVLLLALGFAALGTGEEVEERKPVSAEELPEEPPEAVLDSAAVQNSSPAAGLEKGLPKADTAKEETPDISPLIKTARRNFEKGQYQSAKKAASLALDISPRDYEAVKLRGMAAYKLGDLTGARENFETARTAKMKDAEFDLYSGALFAREGDYVAAEKEFQKAKGYSAFSRSARLMKKSLSFLEWKALRQRAAAAVGEKMEEGYELDPLTVAILSTGGETGDTAALGKATAEALSVHLSAIKRLHVVERGEVQVFGGAWAEKGKTFSGKAGAAAFGKLLKAGNIVTFSLRGDSAGWSLSGAVTDAVTGQASEIAAIGSVPDSLLSLERIFAGAILKVLDLPPAPDEVEKLQRPFAHNLNAFESYATGLDAEDRGDFQAAAEEYRNAMNQDSWFKRAAAARRRAERLAECAAVEDLSTVAPISFFDALMD